MGYRASSLDELGDGYGFRKVRERLGVTAFGVNFLVYPPRYDGIGHYHETQDELYLVHRGRARFDVDGDTFEVGAGGIVHVESITPRRVSNAGDEDLVLLVVGGKGGYVERDGRFVSEEDAARRRALSEGTVGQ
jgi:mannose-6-phosphate isomerase-like protein (cupin superfamily)